MGELRSIGPSVLALLAVVLGFVAQGRFAEDHVTDAVILYALAAVLFAWALRASRFPAVARAEGGAYHPWRLRGALALLVLSALLGVLALRRFDQETMLAPAWRLHLASLGTFLVALAVLGRRKGATGGEAPAYLPWEWVLLALVVTLGCFMRLYRLNEFPFGTWYDEADNGLHALHMLEDPTWRPVYVESTNLPAHYLYLVALSFRLFGVETIPIRYVSILFGVLTVPAAWGVGRELGGRRLGLVAAFLLAVSRWDVNFSRIALHGVSTPFFEFATVWFLLRGLRTREPADFALGGLSIGLGLCFYAPFRLFPFVVLFFLIHLLATERDFWRAQGVNVLIFGLAALLAVAPVAQFAFKHTDLFLDRTRKTSVFAGKTREEGWNAVRSNLRKHLLMFNYRGDPNGRHNLPGEPMLDYATSVFAVLGMGYALAQWRRPREFLSTYWLFIMLAGGVFSLDFEAPQSLRSIGTLPPAHLLAAMALERLGREVEWAWGGKRRAKQVFAVALAALLAYVGYANYDTYFHRQAKDFASWNAYSTSETIAARLMASLDDTVDFEVISFYHGHPVLRFLARNVPNYRRLDTTDTLPLRRSPRRDIVQILDPDRRSYYLQLKQYYPNADCREYRPPFGGPPVLYTCRLTPADIASIQGLNGAYYAGGAWEGSPQVARKDSVLRFDWPGDAPLPLPFVVEWRGILSVAQYGEYVLAVTAPAAAEVYLDETLLLEVGPEGGQAQAPATLAKGNHAFRVRAVGAEGHFELLWRPPGQGLQTVPSEALYVPPVTNNGLLGKYYPNGEWREPVAFAQIDPRIALYFHIIPLPRPYTVEWTGKIMAPVEGEYRFGLESIDESQVYIDGVLVAESPLPNQYGEGVIYLTAGLHDVRILFADRTSHTHINFYWTPPGGGREIVPPEVLFPPQGSYELIEVPKPVPPQVPAPAAPPVSGTFSAQLDAVWGGEEGDAPGQFRLPRDVAVDPQGYVYVSDTGNHRVQKFTAEGEPVDILTGDGQEAFADPTALEVDADGNLWVLDSETGWVFGFASDGKPIARFGGPQMAFFHPRGLALTPRGTLLVVDTGGSRVVELNAQGALVRQYGLKGSGPGQLDQPTEALVDGNGYIYVVDTANHRVQVLDPDGNYAGEWAIPGANTVDHPSMAWGPLGEMYLTEPEPATVAVVNRQGEVLGRWGGRGDGPGFFEKPLGVAVDGAGRVYVVDAYRHRVQRFVVQRTPAE